MPVLGKFNNSKQDASVNPIGENNSNQILDSRIYELDFPDISIEEFVVNFLSDNLFNQADSDGWDTGIIDEVIGIRKDPSIAVAKWDETFITT